MDEAYQQHSPHSRRHNRSATSLNKLSLAPLTSKLPIDDTELPPLTSARSRSPKPISYIEQRHVAPNTGILSRPTSRSSSRTGLAHRRKISLPKPGEAQTGLTKSKSSTHIHISPEALQRPLHHRHKSGAMTPGPRPLSRHGHGHKNTQSEDFAHLLFSPKIRDGKIDEDDWLLRTSSVLTYGARESKGQAWLVSRASGTSLTNQNRDSDSSDDDDEKRSQEDRISAFLSMRRESGIDADDEFSPVTTRSFVVHSHGGSRYNSVFNSRSTSRVQSRVGSRVHSRRGSKVGLALTPSAIKKMQMEEEEGYFDAVDVSYGKPDFVGLDEEEEEEDLEARAIADELLVRRLAKTPSGLGTWVEKLMGWSLFAVEEDVDAEDDDAGTTDTETEERYEELKERERQHWREMLEKEAEEQGVTLPPPPKAGDEGGWSDAAWLLSVATKVLL